MKQTAIAAMLILASTAYAAEPAPADPHNGMAEMMKNCQGHMKEGKMAASMPKDMMENCQKMMKESGMMPSAAAKEAAPADDKTAAEDHAQHHPAK